MIGDVGHGADGGHLEHGAQDGPAGMGLEQRLSQLEGDPHRSQRLVWVGTSLLGWAKDRVSVLWNAGTIGEVVVTDDDVDAAPGGALDGGMVSNADVRCDDQSDAVLCRLVCGDDREAVAFDESVGDVVVESLASTEEPQGTLEYETGCGAVHVVVRHDANALFAPESPLRCERWPWASRRSGEGHADASGWVVAIRVRAPDRTRAGPSSGPRADEAGGTLARVFVTSGDASRRFHRWCPTESIVTHRWYRVASLVQPQRRTHTVREYDV